MGGFDLGLGGILNGRLDNYQQQAQQSYWGNQQQIRQADWIFHARPETIPPADAEKQAQEDIKRARRMEILYRQARFVKQQELKLEAAELAEDGVLANKFLLGCDPEFVALSADGRVLNVQHTLTHEGEVGWDHSGNVIEVRPKPAKGSYALVKRIQKLLKSPKLTGLTCAKFRAGARFDPYNLGGHIHLGLPINLGVNPEITALDALTKLLEHLDILPSKESAARRKGDYGKFGAIRVKTDGHFEYRTMASWLHDPKVAFMCLTAAKLAVVDPVGTRAALEKATSFKALENWLEGFRGKDDNALRALRINHKDLIKDPGEDFRGRWETLGL